MVITKEQKDFLKSIIELNPNYNRAQKEELKFIVDISLTTEELVQKLMITFKI